MTPERKYRLIPALLSGVGFTAGVTLLLNVPSPVVLILALFLAPGSVLASILFRVHTLGFGPPIPVLTLNALVYSSAAYLVLERWIRPNLHTVKLALVFLAMPVVGLACLACIPSMSPLWPTGMSQLDERERTLREGLPTGSDLNSARGFLRGQGIDSYEYEAKSEETVLERGKLKIVAEPGDHILSAQVHTEAEEFPCGYRIEVVLVFDRQEKLKKSNVARFPLCP